MIYGFQTEVLVVRAIDWYKFAVHFLEFYTFPVDQTGGDLGRERYESRSENCRTHPG
jgi:hypothetical protein